MIDPIPINAPAGMPTPAPSRSGTASKPGHFASELDRALIGQRDVRFSAHAMQRLNNRNIQLSETDHARIAKSTNAAAAKGAREALLLMDRLALIVGVPNRTVITVMEPDQAHHTVFTNIDTVVVVGSDST